MITWLRENERLWRGALLALLAVAMIGPWAFGDRISTLGGECLPPWMPVGGDLCVERVSGGVQLFAFADDWVQRAAAGNPLGSAMYELFFLALYFLPLLSSLLLLLFGGRRPLVGFHLIAVVLGVGYILFMAAVIGHPLSLQIWGLWLYVITALVSLALEIALLPGRRQAHVPA
jgi:hypothetical protein